MPEDKFKKAANKEKGEQELARRAVSDGERKDTIDDIKMAGARNGMKLIGQAKRGEEDVKTFIVAANDDNKATLRLLDIPLRDKNYVQTKKGELHINARKMLRAIEKRGVDCSALAAEMQIDLTDLPPKGQNRG